MLVGRTGLSPTMVGRSAPLARLAGLLTSAGRNPDTPAGQGEDGRPAVALVAGEAGIGKTRLLRELIASAPAGTAVLAGGAEPGSLGRPYELVRSMLGSLPDTDGDLTRAVMAAMETRLGDRRSLVVFEDLHWADAESLAIFERLAASSHRSLLLVGTYRPDELTRRVPAADVLLRVERRHRVHQIRLDRLRPGEVASFLQAVYRRPIPTLVADTLYNRTGGNPFFLEEILIAAGDLEPEQLCAQPLPWSLAEVVQRNLEGLSTEDRRVVEAAAVLGRRAPFDVLARMTGCTEDELITHLRGLVERGLLVEEDDDQFSFRHALVRDAVEGQLLGRERRRLHGIALAALEDAPCADLAQLARHAAGAGEYERLVTLAREGVAHYLGRGSSHQALMLAADALPEAPDDLVLLEGATRAAWLTGQGQEALGYAERWLAVAERTGDATAQAAASRLLARIHHDLGNEDELWRMAAAIEALTEQLPPGEERAKNLAALAQMHMLREHPAEAVALAERAIADAEVADAKPVRAQAMVERGSALGDLPGRFAEGEQALREGIAEAEAVGDWVLVSRGLNNLGKYIPAESAENVELVRRMREAAERAGFMRAAAALRSTRHAIALGDLAKARADIEEARELVAHDGHKGVWVYNLDAFLLLEEGRFDAAAEQLDLPADRADHQMYTWRQGLRLALATLRGEEATEELQEVLGRSTGYREPLEALEALHDDLELGARLGLEEAELRSRVLTPWNAAARERPPSHHALNEATLAAIAGRHEQAVEGLEHALDHPEDLHLPVYRRAALRCLLARSLAALGRRTEAAHQAAIAVDMLERWPGWRLAEAKALLANLQSARSSDDDASGLSPREREVAALLAEGLSNAELARRLYISPKTAAVHVSNILAKLGMSSRTEVAAWAVRQGLGAAEPVRPAGS